MSKNMKKNIQKALVFIALFCSLFFTNIKKGYAEITECYYLVPNSNVDYNRSLYRNPVASNEDNRYYYRIVLKKNNKSDVKSWNNGDKRSVDGEYISSTKQKKISQYVEEGCPKYLKMSGEDAPAGKIGILKSLNESGDSYYKTFVTSYYNISTGKSPVDFGNAFRIDYERDGIYKNLYYLPEPISIVGVISDRTSFSTLDANKHFYIPLYYYKDNNSGSEKKCYLSDMLNKSANSDCTVSYNGEDPAKKYTTYTVDAYRNIATSAIADFKTSCASGKTDDYNIYLDDVIGFARNNNYQVTDGASSECIAASKNLGRLSAAILGWVTAYSASGIDSSYGETSGFKSYREIFESLKQTSTSFNDKVNKFLFLKELRNLEEITDEAKENLFMNIYGAQMASDSETRLNTLRNYSNICSFVSDYNESNQCYTTYNTCYSDTNMDSCLHMYSNNPSIQQSACYGTLDNCMSQTITSWDTAKSQWNAAVNNLTDSTADIYSRLRDAQKVSIEINVYNPLHGIGTVTTDPIECSDVIALRVIWIILEIGAPVLVIALGILDFTKAVVAGDDAKISKAKQNFPKRLIALFILILSPIIIKTLISFIDNNNVNNIDLIKCIINGE